jgi:succinyl-CoA synthetase beta subunit
LPAGTPSGNADREPDGLADEIADRTTGGRADRGPDGIAVKKVLIAAQIDIAKEFYVAVTLDRKLGVPVLIA